MTAWKERFTIDLLSQKGIDVLLQLKEEFSLSYVDIEIITGMPKSSLQDRATKTFGPRQRPGTKPKISFDDSIKIISDLKEKRKQFAVVQLVDVQRTADIIVEHKPEEGKEDANYISPSTAFRLLRAHNWSYKRTHTRVPSSDTKDRPIYISNFLEKVRLAIALLNLTRDQLYTMDESGVHTDLARKYTFTYSGDKNVYVKVPNDSTKDTIVVTLAASGGGFLYYVPYTAQSSDHKAVKGVGTEQIKEWARVFIGRIQNDPGLLLLDNLSAHKDTNLIQYLNQHGIYVLPIPVRCADELSVLDNSFFHAYKANLSLLFPELVNLSGQELRTRKQSLIQ
jgi:hypothetical protein